MNRIEGYPYERFWKTVGETYKDMKIQINHVIFANRTGTWLTDRASDHFLSTWTQLTTCEEPFGFWVSLPFFSSGFAYLLWRVLHTLRHHHESAVSSCWLKFLVLTRRCLGLICEADIAHSHFPIYFLADFIGNKSLANYLFIYEYY